MVILSNVPQHAGIVGAVQDLMARTSLFLGQKFSDSRDCPVALIVQC